MRTVDFQIEGLSVYRAVEKLRREIPVLSASKTAKNTLIVRVEAKNRKKAFAILRDSCYNVIKITPTGAEAVRLACLRGVGLFVGGALALAMLFILQGRVLRIDIEGSGSYLFPEVQSILKEEGVTLFSPMPRETGPLTARILALPRVHFCAFGREGGIFTVVIETGDELEPLLSQPLLIPETGEVEELIVLRGTALVKVGDSVKKGQTAVAPYTLSEKTQLPCLVAARVRVKYAVSREYPLGEEQARLQAMLEFGSLEEIVTYETAGGTRVEGIAHAEGALNLG